MLRITRVAVLTGVLLLTWSAVFASTFKYPFYWDDYHLIRSYTGSEIRSAFHAVADPDQIETPGLRPCSILLFNFQGSSFGENVIAHRVFMVVLMGIFMIVVGTLLLELGLSFVQLGIVFLLFVSSRVFASLVLWISLSHLILAYIWIGLTTYLFVLWAKRGCWLFFLLMVITATLGTFTREETYTLPIVLPLLWLICFFDLAPLRRVMAGALILLAIVCFHYWLWHFLVPNALSPKLNFSAVKRFLTSIAASWLPCGYQMVGFADMLLGFLWIGFLSVVVWVFVKFGRQRVRWQFLGACAVGILLCLPALAIARPFGNALPTLAFATAISIVLGETYIQIQSRSEFRQWQRGAMIGGMILGFAAGIYGGTQRSFYVAQSLRPDCALRAARDGEFLFDLPRLATIPPQRRQAGLARMENFGIYSADDVLRLEKTLKNTGGPDQPKQMEHGLFVSKYEYLSF